MNATQNYPQMQQHGHASNNVQIGHAGSGNSFHIQQTQGSFRDQPIQFEYNPKLDERVYEKKQLVMRTAVTAASFAATLLVSLIGLFSDVLSIGTQFGISKDLMRYFLVMTPVIIFFVNFKYIAGFLRRPKSTGESRYLGMGKFLRREDNDIYKVVGYIARCNVPGCDGTVHIVNTPPREKGNFEFVGACSNSPRSHTYEIARNFKGYHRQLDWRPIKENNPG